MRGPVDGDPTALPSWEPRPGVGPTRILATPRMCPYGPLPAGVDASVARALEALEAATGPADRADRAAASDVDRRRLVPLVAAEERDVGRPGDPRPPRWTSSPRPFASRTSSRRACRSNTYVAARRRRFESVKVLDQSARHDAVLVSPTMCVEGFLADGRFPGSGEGDVDADADRRLQHRGGEHHRAPGDQRSGGPVGERRSVRSDDHRAAVPRRLLLALADRWEAARRGRSRLRASSPSRSYVARSRRRNVTSAIAYATTGIAASTMTFTGSVPSDTGCGSANHRNGDSGSTGSSRSTVDAIAHTR